MGFGLRLLHYASVVTSSPRVGWFEVISENFMVPGGNPRRVLRSVRERYPVVLHGVSLSNWIPGPLDERYLDGLSTLADEVQPAWVSDHLCWSSFGGHTGHGLWPLSIHRGVARARGRTSPMSGATRPAHPLEKVSTFLQFASSTIPEWEMLSGARPPHRLRRPARRQQRVRQRGEQRVRRRTLRRTHRRRGGRAGAPRRSR